MALARKETIHDIDFVTPIPETARIAAEAYASGIGKPIHELVIKNRYVGRGFIKPPRERSLDMYGGVVRSLVRGGASVALVDDSIIRGDTLRKVLPKLRLRVRGPYTLGSPHRPLGTRASWAWTSQQGASWWLTAGQ